MNNIYLDQTLGEIVTKQHNAARIFEKYHLDFCCRGKRKLSVACAENNIAETDVLQELQALNKNASHHISFDKLSLIELINHISVYYHHYIKQNGPSLREHLNRVAYKHGNKFPWMIEVSSIFNRLLDELLTHIHREEMVLFPRIKALERKLIDSDALTPNAVQMMETEHEQTGRYMQRLHEVTDNFSCPSNACTTFRISMMEMKEFEEKLYEHVHLENNILFPKALALSYALNN